MTAGDRFASLDGWRAVAITLVLLSHTWATNNPPQVPAWLLPLMSQGDLGVRIFFVLSGFLITTLLIAEHARYGDISLRNFYVRRALRIFPVYYLYLLVLAVLQALSLTSEAFSSWAGSLTYTRNMFGRGDSATGHLWSLAVEEQFYLVWPAALVALGLCRRWQLAIGILLAIALMAIVVRAAGCTGDTFLCQRLLGHKSALRYADSLAVGCIGAFLRANMALQLPHGVRVAMLYGSMAALVMLSGLTWSNPVMTSAVVTAQAVVIMASIGLSMTTRETVLFRLLNSRLAVFVGAISYSLYIWHVLFLSHYMGPGISGSLLHDGRVWWLPAIIVAAFSYFAFERRIIALKDRLQTKRVPLPAQCHLQKTQPAP